MFAPRATFTPLVGKMDDQLRKSGARRTATTAVLCTIVLWGAATSVLATPANRAALDRHYDRFLGKDLNKCTTCHLPSARKDPANLNEFPHNKFGDRLKTIGQDASKLKDMGARFSHLANEDADADGVPNETELLLGTNPGDSDSIPTKQQLRSAKDRRAEFARFLAGYRWRPFETVARPAIPKITKSAWIGNSVDAFIAAEHSARKLKPRPAAPKEVLLRRVYLDLIGLSPTPEEQRAFASDDSPEAYEKVVDRLLRDPRHGERWARHWMDIWRYSDWAGWTDGNQVRDSKPHIWRWRDWIVDSLNDDRGYDRMMIDMLAADEAAPLDTNALRATGFLVRNYKMLSREQWMEDTIKHTAQAFLGVTVGCAKCHDHMTDPIAQADYYRMRAIFEPHHVRTDKLPGQLDTMKDGLVRAFDTATNRLTYLFVRGDERHPDTNKVLEPGIPLMLCGYTPPAKDGGRLAATEVTLPRDAAYPDHREFVIRDTIAASEKAIDDARQALVRLATNASPDPDKLKEQGLSLALAGAKHKSLLATLDAEKLEDKRDSNGWKAAATNACLQQRSLAVEDARLKLHQAQVALAAADKKNKDVDGAKKKVGEAQKALAEAEKEAQAVPTANYKPRPADSFPGTSTGRRLAFAQWLADTNNPLTARVAVNHIWLRHFGRGLVPTAADLGRSGQPPSHPQLLDWLAAEFMAGGWSMRHLHRLIVTSSTYRMASTSEAGNAAIDPDNVYLWKMNSRRLEAESIRDNVLYAAGNLDPAMGGPDIDHKLGLTSKRRSLYLRVAAEKEVEFLKIFDGPSITECYQRRPSVMPQQALALGNSDLAFAQARTLAKSLVESSANDAFAAAVFERVLARHPRSDELKLCVDFLNGSSSPERGRENLILVLFNHNDFVTVR